jgi:hypothetical protein
MASELEILELARLKRESEAAWNKYMRSLREERDMDSWNVHFSEYKQAKERYTEFRGKLR